MFAAGSIAVVVATVVGAAVEVDDEAVVVVGGMVAAEVAAALVDATDDVEATLSSSFIYCAESRAQAEEEGVKYVLDYYESLENHYRWASSDKYKKIDSYQFYADLGEERSKASEAETVEALIKNSLFGTPAEIVEKVEAQAAASGCDEVISPFLYGKMPFEKAEKMLRLFLTEALPKIQKLPVKQAADFAEGHRSPPTVAAF